jgi:uncharacterized protein YndB with AHSA1/START domain
MSQADDGQVLFDFLSHAETLIQAPAEKVWAAVLNPSDWHGTLMIHVSGPRHEVGEELVATPPDQPDAVMLRIHNVEMEPNRRRTIRIHTPEDVFTGYSTWVLHERGGETLVGYDVFTRYPFPREMTVDQIRDLSSRGNEEGLRRLKAFVETGERP